MAKKKKEEDMYNNTMRMDKYAVDGAKESYENSNSNMRKAIKAQQEKEKDFTDKYKKDLQRAFGRKAKKQT